MAQETKQINRFSIVILYPTFVDVFRTAFKALLVCLKGYFLYGLPIGIVRIHTIEFKLSQRTTKENKTTYSMVNDTFLLANFKNVSVEFYIFHIK